MGLTRFDRNPIAVVAVTHASATTTPPISSPIADLISASSLWCFRWQMNTCSAKSMESPMSNTGTGIMNWLNEIPVQLMNPNSHSNTSTIPATPSRMSNGSR